MTFAFQIASPAGALPPALTDMTVQLPAGMGIDTAGLATCSHAALEAHGPSGCPRDARVGSGTVVVKVPLGEVVRRERARLTVFNAARVRGHLGLLFYAVGRVPIATQLIFRGVILTEGRGARIEATIPLIPTLPDQPDAALVSLSSTLGTLEQRYSRTVAGRQVSIRPRGVTIPAVCPPGSLQFSATFRFNDGSGAAAKAQAACKG